MVGNRVPAAALSAAALGSRNGRRQLRAVLAAAAEVGAYSVGFRATRGGLTGFTIYLLGDFAGASQGIKGRGCSNVRRAADVVHGSDGGRCAAYSARARRCGCAGFAGGRPRVRGA